MLLFIVTCSETEASAYLGNGGGGPTVPCSEAVALGERQPPWAPQE